VSKKVRDQKISVEANAAECVKLNNLFSKSSGYSAGLSAVTVRNDARL
jgi:hypothetical protein